MNIDTLITAINDQLNNQQMFYALAYNTNGSPTVGMRLFGDFNNNVKDVFVNGTDFLISGSCYHVGPGGCGELTTCRSIADADVKNLVVAVRAQGIVNGQIEIIPIGNFLVRAREVVSKDFGLLTISR